MSSASIGQGGWDAQAFGRDDRRNAGKRAQASEEDPPAKTKPESCRSPVADKEQAGFHTGTGANQEMNLGLLEIWKEGPPTTIVPFVVKLGAPVRGGYAEALVLESSTQQEACTATCTVKAFTLASADQAELRRWWASRRINDEITDVFGFRF